MINEFLAKKLGEVAAFALIGKETLEKGRPALEPIIGKEAIENTLASHSSTEATLHSFAASNHITESVLSKQSATSEKLRAMRDLYIKEEWGNPTELMEWSGFFEGAAIVHWKLVLGGAEAVENIDLTNLAKNNVEFHTRLLEESSAYLLTIGNSRSQS